MSKCEIPCKNCKCKDKNKLAGGEKAALIAGFLVSIITIYYILKIFS